MSGYIFVDLDKTLAKYEHGDFSKFGAAVIGEPIMPMVNRVKGWLSKGKKVKIFTARLEGDASGEIKKAIEAWTEEHIGTKLEVTNVKTRDMYLLYDDRARQVIVNTGELVQYPIFDEELYPFLAKHKITHEKLMTALKRAAAFEKDLEEDQRGGFYWANEENPENFTTMEEYLENGYSYCPNSMQDDYLHGFYKFLTLSEGE